MKITTKVKIRTKTVERLEPLAVEEELEIGELADRILSEWLYNNYEEPDAESVENDSEIDDEPGDESDDQCEEDLESQESA